MSKLKLPYEKPKNLEEVARNYEAVQEHYARLGREACIRAGRWAKEKGFDKIIEQYLQELKEMINTFEEEIFPEGETINPFRFRVWIAMEPVSYTHLTLPTN